MLKSKKILALLLVLSILICQIPLFTALGAEEKVYYNNFNSGLSTTPTATGNGDNTAYVYGVDGLTYTCADGVLNLKMTNGNYIRMCNSMIGIDAYKYMVVRMKGTHTRGANLTGNSIAFFFGSASRVTDKTKWLYVPAENLTADYSDVVIEIPEGYFEGIPEGWESCMFISTDRGSSEEFFDISINEIYFANSLSDEEPEVPEVPEVPEEPEVHEDVIYSEFTNPLIKGTPVSNGADGTVTLFEILDATQSVVGGCLNVSFAKESAYIRFTSSVELTEDCATTKYKYMVMKVKGSAAKDGQPVTSGQLLKIVFGNWGNESNCMYIDASQVNADTFSTVVLELSDANFASIDLNYKTGLIIRNPGDFSSEVVIDSIYFTDVKPDTEAQPDPEEPTVTGSVYYNNFNNGLGDKANNATPTGNGTNTSFVNGIAGLTYSCANGALHLEMTNGNYLRISNTMTGIKNYKYMVVRMRGTHDRTDFTPSDNTIGFLFGNIGRLWDDGDDSDIFFVSNEQLTSDYSNVVFEIPEGYFDAITDSAYRSELFIVTKRGANFVIDIDEIYFTNNYTEDFPEPDDKFTDGDLNGDSSIDVRDIIRLKKALAQTTENPFYDVDGNSDNNSSDIVFYRKVLLDICEFSERGKVYSDFATELKLDEFVASGEGDEQVKLYYADNTDYTTENGSLDATLKGERSYLRFVNTLPLADTQGNYYYDNMVITLNGYIENSAGEKIDSGNMLKVWFGALGNESSAFYITADQVDDRLYTKIVVPLNSSNFANLPQDYVSGLFIMNAGLSNVNLSIDEIRFCDNAPGNTGITKGEASLYEFSSQLSDSSIYDVKINGEEAFVYETNVNSRRESPSGNSSDVLSLSKAGVVSFDMTGNVEIEIALDSGNISSAKVTPQSEGITSAVSNGKMVFTISRSGQYTVELNGGTSQVLNIFANPMETDPVYASSSDTIYYGPGVHYANEITLEAGQTLYLAGGAVVYGHVTSGADNITIRGRGYLDGSVYSRYQADGVTTNHKVPINLAYSNNVNIEGIACLDPCGWTYNLYNCSDVDIKNVKIISSRQNGDGISVQSCSNVTVSRSFVRSWDDSLVVKNYDDLSTSNIAFTDCIIWTDLAQSMEVGYETLGSAMTDITFKNITVLHNFHKAVMSIHNSDYAAISNVTFENITVEDAQMGSGDGSDYLVDLEVAYSPVWSDEDSNVRGSISGVNISNVKVLSGITPKIRIAGYDNTHKVSDVTLSGINIKGTPVTSINNTYFEIGNYTSNITVN